jgi:glycerol kinase
MSSYILAIDQGTTSSRVVIYNEKFDVVGIAQEAFPQQFPQPDWVEHDPEEIWESVLHSMHGALENAASTDAAFSVAKIKSIGITNQRETFVLWDRKTGKAVHNAIVWQCRRSADLCKKLRKVPAAKKAARDAGLVLDPYFSATKLLWIFEKYPEIHARAKKGEIAFGTMDSFLIWRLTGGKDHATDVTNASRTLLFDIAKMKWNPAALRVFKCPEKILPHVLSSDGNFGKTLGVEHLPDGISICGVLGDQQAALLGQACISKGEAKITYGTGSFMVFNSGSQIRRSKNALTTVAWKIAGKTTYAMEGSVFVAGAMVQWLRDQLKMISNSKEIEVLAREVESSEGCFVIPSLTGLGSPYWVPGARGLIGGLTRKISKAHIARASLEGVALSIADVCDAIAGDLGFKLKSIHVDGGASANNLLMQVQANYLGIRILRPTDRETTVRGAAYAAAFGCGMKKSLDEIKGLNSTDAEFAPNGLTLKQRKEVLKKFRIRVQALIDSI